MSSEHTEATFFDAKRSWSRIKDRVLGSYMLPYLVKVSRLGRRILIVDCFAGEGKFSDGSAGSPLIICQQIRARAAGKAKAIFINKHTLQHQRLAHTIGDFVKSDIAQPVLGDASALLKQVGNAAGDQTLFVYLDPFGLKDCDFDTIRSLLERGSERSTEILINLSMPILHRLAACHAVAEGRGETPAVCRFHRVLDRVLGGSYWRSHVFDASLTASEKESRIVDAYRQRLKEFLPYVCSCPVREADDARTKHYIIFASRHPDAIVLMNDIMIEAYNDHTFDTALKKVPLIAPAMPDWRSSRLRERAELDGIVVEKIGRQPGILRRALWEVIVTENFMRFRETEFKHSVSELLEGGRLVSPTSRRTKRLNDSCALYPSSARIGPGTAPATVPLEQSHVR